MESSLGKQSTPGPIDNPASKTTLGSNMDFDKDSSPGRPVCPDIPSDRPQEEPKEKQNENKTYEFGTYERVLWCVGLNLTYNYGKLFNIYKEYGPIEKIKVKILNKTSISAFITFVSNISAKEAKEAMLNKDEMKEFQFSIISSKNLADEDSDYIPKLFSEAPIPPMKLRELPIPYWFIANYKHSNINSLKGLLCLEKYVGAIPNENFKKYGKCSLVKAKNDLQAYMLLHLTLTEEDIISTVKPHNSFNLTKGVIHSQELQEFSEKEILNLCPDNIYSVKKILGRNNTIILDFSSRYLPDYVDIRHLQFRVRKFRPKPTLCFKCFEYGHVAKYCQNKKKCDTCSVEITNENHKCSEYYCFHCEEKHSPLHRSCLRYKFEQDIVEIAHCQFVSYGKAKNLLMGANKSPGSSYAKVITNMKVNNIRKNNSNPTTEEQQLINANAELDSASGTSRNTHLDKPHTASPTITKLIGTTNIEIHNRFDALVSLDNEEDNINTSSSHDMLSDDTSANQKASTKRREHENGSPPRPKKPNTQSNNIITHNDKTSEMETEMEEQQRTQSITQPDSNTISQLNVENKIQDQDISHTSIITPSPIIGTTGRLLNRLHPRTKSTVDHQSPSTEIGSSPNSEKVKKLHITQQNIGTPYIHHKSCGCNECVSQIN